VFPYIKGGCLLRFLQGEPKAASNGCILSNGGVCRPPPSLARSPAPCPLRLSLRRSSRGTLRMRAQTSRLQNPAPPATQNSSALSLSVPCSKLSLFSAIKCQSSSPSPDTCHSSLQLSPQDFHS
jgi:hypothetical protein